MNITALVDQLIAAGVKLKIKDNNLVVKLPKVISADLREQIIANKTQLKEYYLAMASSESPADQITVQPHTEAMPLSFSQQALWFSEQSDSQANYNVPVNLKITGKFDVELAQQALNGIMDRHLILKTTYSTDAQETLRQVIHHDAQLSIHRETLPAAQLDDAKIQYIVNEEAQRGFDLQNELPIRCRAIALTGGAEPVTLLLLTLHHIATDGWSMALLVKEFTTLYESLIKGEAAQLTAMDIQYADFAQWQHQYNSDKSAKQLDYWRAQLDGLPHTHSLPLDGPRDSQARGQGGILNRVLPETVKQGLQTLASRFDMTTFMLLHAALALVFSRHSRSHDIVIGSPQANRQNPQLHNLIGFFVNTLVYRVNTEQASLADYLHHVRQVHIDAQLNQEVPFEALVQALTPTRTPGQTPLFQIIVDTDNDYQQSDAPGLPGIKLEPLTHSAVTIKYDLDLALKMTESGVSCYWAYDRGLFTEHHVGQLADDLCNVLTHLSQPLTASDTTLKALYASMAGNTLTPEINTSSSATHSILEQVSQIAQFAPERVAAQHQQHSLSYAALDARANKLADWLIAQNYGGRDKIIAIEASRTLDTLVAILAIWKAGCAYLPIDPAHPQQRIQFMLEDSCAIAVLGRAGTSALQTAAGQSAVPYLDMTQCDEADLVARSARQTSPDADSLAYVIYTSGTTGKPKGVMIEHANLNHYLTHLNTQLAAQVTDGVVSTSLSFDATVTSLFMPLLRGGVVNLTCDEDKASEQVVQALETAQTALLFKLTPAHLQLIAAKMTQQNSHKHVIILGGEQLNLDTIAQLRSCLPETVFVNEYGPTETTVGSHWKCIEEGHQTPISMGAPITNMQGIVLDEDGHPVPPYAIGELYLTGPGVARGYLNRPQLSAERFIDNPAYQSGQSACYRKLYKTGDLVRTLGNSEMTFIGRIDEQVKLNGYRIELEEVKRQIAEQGLVEQAEVLLVEQQAQMRLVAFIELTSEGTLLVNQQGEAAMTEGLIQALAEQLPEYMIPADYLVIEHWPLTVNGKLDSNQLAELATTQQSAVYAAPETEMEAHINQLWADILSLQEREIGRDGHFFKLGGNSILLIKMLGSLKKQWGISLAFNEVFNRVVLRDLAQYVQQKVTEKQAQEALEEKATEAEGWL
ncbi:non-ribosomal peptide synthetase [Pseudoalteromonas sp. PPB1]|uniref:non-ribosomal peptide synthetase n=1 Tax=Pseudoalteromonas sp. PPB1 TaxID=2756136 RepID=UPI001891A9DA|nr:non-ribosomal peptide synthetase [Pseudoalteromonas sp. PPB1]